VIFSTSFQLFELILRSGEIGRVVGRFRERKFQGAKVPWAKVLGTFAPGSESSRERKFLGESSRERKFHTMVLLLPGAKVLRSESSIIRRRQAQCTMGRAMAGLL